ncbi:MAG: hypothetical protein NVSMB52_13730 [Chloroflexota bacterium]
MESLLTTEDVAEFFRMDVVTVRRMVNKGELPAYRVGGEFRFKHSDIDDYLQRQRVPARKNVRERLGTLARQARTRVKPGGAPAAFELFTDRTRSVLVLAQEEAQQLGHNYLGTEHVLLGVLREKKGVGARLLGEFGCDLDGMRRSVRQIVGSGPHSEQVQDEMRLTPNLKRVLEMAGEEATRLDHAFVGTEHLVLGLLQDGDGVAGRLLKDLGMEIDPVRTRVQEILTQPRGR